MAAWYRYTLRMLILVGTLSCTPAPETAPDPGFFDDLFGHSDDSEPLEGGSVTGYLSIQSWPSSPNTLFEMYTVKGTLVRCTDCFYAFEGVLQNEVGEVSGHFTITPIDQQVGPFTVGRAYLDELPLGYAYPFGDGSTYISNALAYYHYQLDEPPAAWSQLYRGTFYY